MAENTAPPFVPVEEQPYPVPGNWVWVRLDMVCDGFQYGYTAKATRVESGSRFIRITDIGGGIINDQSAPFCVISKEDYSKFKISKNDILIARMGSVGENGLATHDIDGVFASYLIRVVPKITTTFVLDYLQSDLYGNRLQIIQEEAQG